MKPAKTINNYSDQRCDCSEDDNSGCPFYSQDQEDNKEPKIKKNKNKE